ncbi:MAG: hypothetical protein HY721_03850 [Planctomycetes bacterium]|nr:hypothetical protein [Planctomycetota bacterium]
MPAYDANWFDPPAPVARVTLRNGATGQVKRDVPMLLDWGADVTLLPREATHATSLESVPGKQYELESFDGARTYAPVVQAEIAFLGKIFRGQFLISEREWGVLGRNVLNSVAILCDGPRLHWDERGGTRG